MKGFDNSRGEYILLLSIFSKYFLGGQEMINSITKLLYGFLFLGVYAYCNNQTLSEIYGGSWSGVGDCANHEERKSGKCEFEAKINFNEKGDGFSVSGVVEGFSWRSSFVGYYKITDSGLECDVPEDAIWTCDKVNIKKAVIDQQKLELVYQWGNGGWHFSFTPEEKGRLQVNWMEVIGGEIPNHRTAGMCIGSYCKRWGSALIK